MTSCSNRCPDLRRARPLLGTLVEITVPATAAGARALNRAYETISKVQALMSAHDQTSDLGRIAQAPARTFVTVHPWTWRVLATALRLARESRGAFDPVAIASEGRASWRDLRLRLDRRSVFKQKPLRIDLGGIAKGFAVDQAVRSLMRDGLPWGLVNAGGDLRAFGGRDWPLHTRHAAAPSTLQPFASVRNQAVATSAPYFSASFDAQPSPLHCLCDTSTLKPLTRTVSATVLARTALIADALTKIVFFLPHAEAEKILAQYHAQARLEISPNQSPASCDHPICA